MGCCDNLAVYPQQPAHSRPPLPLPLPALQVLTHMTRKRPVDINRVDFILQAEAFACLVKLECVQAEGASPARPSTLVGGKPSCSPVGLECVAGQKCAPLISQGWERAASLCSLSSGPPPLRRQPLTAAWRPSPRSVLRMRRRCADHREACEQAGHARGCHHNAGQDAGPVPGEGAWVGLE